ncbi:MAG: hypothetical protein NVS3B20_19710 [Polyangiales bacterium]
MSSLPWFRFFIDCRAWRGVDSGVALVLVAVAGSCCAREKPPPPAQGASENVSDAPPEIQTTASDTSSNTPSALSRPKPPPFQLRLTNMSAKELIITVENHSDEALSLRNELFIERATSGRWVRLSGHRKLVDAEKSSPCVVVPKQQSLPPLAWRRTLAEIVDPAARTPAKPPSIAGEGRYRLLVVRCEGGEPIIGDGFEIPHGM